MVRRPQGGLTLPEILVALAILSLILSIAAPAYSASLAYYDAVRRARLPGNVIQAQRDFFGGHTYNRTDKPGTFHMEWKEGGTEILQVEGKSRTK